MFYDLIPKVSKVVGVVLNPLKALGYNQVLEKNAAGFTTMNLTKLTFHTGEAKKIQHDKENFVNLSPKFFFNSKLFLRV